jgi:predicted acyl esterase
MREAAPVRLEVRAARDEVRGVREERSWPLLGTRWTKLYLASGDLREAPLEARTTVRFEVPDGGASFLFRAAEDMEIAGPMKLRLYVELQGTTDAYLFAAISKMRTARDGERNADDVVFEGSSGFGCDVVSKGWLRVAHRRIDESRSEPHRPVHPHDRAEPMARGEIASVDIEILPSATFFARGDGLRLDLRGRWFWKRSAFFGMYPFTYAASPGGTVVLHMGAEHDAHLFVPRTG